MLDSGEAVDGELIKVPAVRDVDRLFGAGSVMAEGMKTAFLCCPGNVMEFFALPHHDDSVGADTAAVYTLTFDAPAVDGAESDGRIDLFLVTGRYNTSTRVRQGDTAALIATNVAVELNSEPGLPFIAVATTNVVTLTAKNAGTVGNAITVLYNWHGRRDYAPKGVTMDFKQTVQGTHAAFTPPDYQAILGECCYCCIGMLYANDDWQEAMIAYIASAWDCSKPQCFGHGYTYNYGSFGQIAASDTNSAEVSRIAHCFMPGDVDTPPSGDPVAGWMKAAAYAAHSCCSTIDHPEMNVQGPNFGILTCLQQPESCFQCFTFEEQQVLQATGFVITVPLQGGTGSMTNPMIVNDVTNNRYDENGRFNATWWNVSSRRLAAATADQAAVQLGRVLGLGLYTKNTTIPAGVRGTNPKMILGAFRSWAKSQIGILFSEFEDIDKDIILKTDFEVAPKCQGIPGKLWIDFIYRPPVRISNIIINAKPSLLTNCDRPF